MLCNVGYVYIGLIGPCIGSTNWEDKLADLGHKFLLGMAPLESGRNASKHILTATMQLAFSAKLARGKAATNSTAIHASAQLPAEPGEPPIATGNVCHSPDLHSPDHAVWANLRILSIYHAA